MTTSTQEVSFADATAVKALSSHTYEANFPDDWCIGSGKISVPFVAVCFSCDIQSELWSYSVLLHPGCLVTAAES